MKIKVYIITLLLITISVNTEAQSKKQVKARLDSLFNYVTRISQSTRDSIVDSYKNRSLSANEDTSLQIIDITQANGAVMQMIIIDGDTSYMYNMNTFAVVDLKPYGDPQKDKEFRRMRYHVKKVYPYAKIAADKLNMYNKELATVTSNSKRRKLMKLREKALKEEFEDVIKNMSKTSGRVLIKLIDRETGESTYDIIKEMRGGFKAWTYQGIGMFYGADLKQRFDPKTSEEDEMIERVVQSLIAEGQSIY